MAAAVRPGYKIVHKGMLVWCLLPSAANIPRLRLLLVAIEATLTFAFWAVYSVKADHYMTSCRLWDLPAFTYGGLCSHSSLAEGVQGLDLTAEQLEAIATETKEKRSVQNQEWHLLNKERRNQAARERAKIIPPSPTKKLANSRRFEASTRASKKYHCEVCNSTFSAPADLAQHNTTSKHINNVAKAKAGVVKSKHYCRLCQLDCKYPAHLALHNRSPRHLKQVAATTAAGEKLAEKPAASISNFFKAKPAPVKLTSKPKKIVDLSDSDEDFIAVEEDKENVVTAQAVASNYS